MTPGVARHALQDTHWICTIQLKGFCHAPAKAGRIQAYRQRCEQILLLNILNLNVLRRKKCTQLDFKTHRWHF